VGTWIIDFVSMKFDLKHETFGETTSVFAEFSSITISTRANTVFYQMLAFVDSHDGHVIETDVKMDPHKDTTSSEDRVYRCICTSSGMVCTLTYAAKRLK
jgi:hypothetical protein